MNNNEKNIAEVNNNTDKSNQKTMVYSDASKPINALDAAEDDSGGGLDFLEIWNVIKQRKWIIISISVIIFIITLISTLLINPVYKASATIQINPEDSAKLLDYDVSSNQEYRYNDNSFYTTQYELLKSGVLARKVIDTLHLDEDTPVGKPPQSLFTRVFEGARSSLQKITDSDKLRTIQKSNDKLSAKPIELSFLESLTISPIRSSRIVNISYESGDPELAAKIVNTLTDQFIKMNISRHVNAKSSAENFLKEQLTKAKDRLQQSEEKLVKYTKKTGIISFNNIKSEKQSLTSQSLAATNIALADAEKERIDAESKYKQTNDSSEAMSVQRNSLIQELKKNKANVQVEYQEKLNTYKPDYPLMIELRQRMKELDVEISKEAQLARQVISNTLKSNYLAAKQKEDKIRLKLVSQKKAYMYFKDSSIQYNTLSREVEINQQFYNDLLQRIKEVGIAGSIGVNNISVIDSAQVPYNRSKPNIKMNLLIGIVLGIGSGLGVAFLLDFLDGTVKSVKELESLINSTVLGEIPLVEDKKLSKRDIALLTAKNPDSSIAKAIQSLCTNLLFSTQTGISKSLHITSTVALEGKTSTLINLAITLCQMDKKVLLIDCNIKNPELHSYFGIKNTKGLSSYLTNQVNDVISITRPTAIERLFVIPAGNASTNSTELLSTQRMKNLLALAYERFDTVLIDSPAITDSNDALIISNYVNTTLFVVAHKYAKKKQISDAYDHLQQVKAHIIGTIFAKIKST